jgi:hypothetical protein
MSSITIKYTIGHIFYCAYYDTVYYYNVTIHIAVGVPIIYTIIIIYYTARAGDLRTAWKQQCHVHQAINKH